ncbi:hypothetical protein ARMSODRAFT_42204 [Armillaria solidipes]|uniref:Uncharacterized protein n=1 Tax=Armillaria solidipes TaxID=1076256 RepID=A0A2H3CGY8_9AGAR|nr:hypothetical protein ARMSODRAFT_42204 [Armillaria solidipes]
MWRCNLRCRLDRSSLKGAVISGHWTYSQIGVLTIIEGSFDLFDIEETWLGMCAPVCAGTFRETEGHAQHLEKPVKRLSYLTIYFNCGISIPRGFHSLYPLLPCTRRLLLLNLLPHTHKNGILLPDTDFKRCAFFVYEAFSPPSATTKASSKLYASTTLQSAQHSHLQIPSVVGRPRLRHSEIQGAHLVHEGYFLDGVSWKMR